MKKPSARLHKTAYHEAGHAVMHVLERIAFKYATIVPNEDLAGRVLGEVDPQSYQPDYDLSPGTIRRLESLIRIEYAGQAAEQILTGRKSWNRGSQGDTHGIADKILRLGEQPDTQTAHLHFLFLQTRDALKHHWDKVKAVADALLKNQTVTSREVHQVIHDLANAELEALLKKNQKRFDVITVGPDVARLE